MIIIYCPFHPLVKCVPTVILKDQLVGLHLLLWNKLDMSIRILDFDHFKSRIKTELYIRYLKLNVICFFIKKKLCESFILNLYSIASLIVSANRLAMCTCIIIAVLIYHDVIIQILRSISMWIDTHTGLKKAAF